LRILLDESVPRRLAEELGDVDVDSVHDRGWSGLKNGELLRKAESDYDVFVTTDQNLQFQQRLTDYALGVIVLAAQSNRLADLVPLVPQLLEEVTRVGEGAVVIIRGVPPKSSAI
jgi:predicted nuclease of predicted toxin-antitoxin system